ncbi:MAG: TIGR02206 family membrane protein [Proteobacteria bacterium]|nr:TIGR02206 family membrane protein [Pseudomonadota bacterium]
MPANFVLFGTSHWAVIALTFLVPLALVRSSRGQERTHIAEYIRWSLAFLLLADWAAWMTLVYERGWLGWGNALPFNLCDWATIAAIATLIRPNQYSYELAYFWGLGGTMQALITPDLVYDFPDVRFVIFFFYHCIIIISVLYLTFGMRLRPYPISILRSLMWSFAYVAVAGTVNILLGTNYGFLTHKPEHTTIFVYLSDWPWYIPELVGVALLSALIYYAPWFVADRFKHRTVMSPA